jgi:ankyrin repeat protein
MTIPCFRFNIRSSIRRKKDIKTDKRSSSEGAQDPGSDSSGHRHATNVAVDRRPRGLEPHNAAQAVMPCDSYSTHTQHVGNSSVHTKGKLAPAAGSQSTVVSSSSLRYQHRLGQSSAPDPSSGKEAALRFAATTGNQEHVKLLLDQGSSDQTWAPPVESDIVHLAAEAGQDQIIQLLLDRGFQAESWRSNTINGVPIMESPIQLAAANGHEGAVRVLLDNGANVNSRHPDCPRQYPPLHLAAVAGHLGVVLLLVEQGADVSAESSSGMTALHLAAHSGRHLVASVLLRNGADPNRRCTKTGMTGRQITPSNAKTRQKGATLQISSQTEVEGLNANDGDHTSNPQDLLADKDVEEHEPWEGGTPLHFAAISGHTELVFIHAVGERSRSKHWTPSSSRRGNAAPFCYPERPHCHRGASSERWGGRQLSIMFDPAVPVCPFACRHHGPTLRHCLTFDLQGC